MGRWTAGCVVVVGALTASCAQVPRESVELSATVGRDLVTVQQAHRQLAQTLFARMRSDVNRFVDDVYAPWQIRTAMLRQAELASSTDANERKKSLLLAINAAFRDDAGPALQDAVMKGMGSLVAKIHTDVESMRAECLQPLADEERDVLGSIDRAYLQLHYANSIVTAHLASIAAVHDAQDEMLRAIGVERDLRRDVGERLASASDDIARLVASARSADASLDETQQQAQRLKSALRQFGRTLQPTVKEE